MAHSETMHAWRIGAFNEDVEKAIDSMTLEDIPVPTPGEGQMLIKVHYSSINPIDWKLFTGGYQEIAPIASFPYTPGFDVAGTVLTAALGFNIGDKVCANIGLLESCRDPCKLPGGPAGAFAIMAVVPADLCVKLHDDTKLKDVAGLPLAGMTSYQALFSGSTATVTGEALGDAKEGTKVLILGGAGGTGALAVQMAKKAGCFVASTASATPISEGSEVTKIDLVEGLGADVVINYKKDDWGEMLKGADYDIIYDCVGIPEDLSERAPKVLKEGGLYVTIANFEGKAQEKFRFAPFIVKSDKKELQALVDMVEKGDLLVPLDSEHEFADLKTAMKHSHGGRSTGKIIVKMAAGDD